MKQAPKRLQDHLRALERLGQLDTFAAPSAQSRFSGSGSWHGSPTRPGMPSVLPPPMRAAEEHLLNTGRDERRLRPRLRLPRYQRGLCCCVHVSASGASAITGSSIGFAAWVMSIACAAFPSARRSVCAPRPPACRANAGSPRDPRNQQLGHLHRVRAFGDIPRRRGLDLPPSSRPRSVDCRQIGACAILCRLVAAPASPRAGTPLGP